MKEKIKKIIDIIKPGIKKVVDYTLTNEFKTFVMVLLVFITTLSICWGVIMTALTDDITNVAIEQKEEITKLEEQVDYLSTETARYKMISEEYYELFIDCVSSCSWYEDFYYDNVSPYTGEIEGEYYE